MLKIAITGSTGLVGSRVVELLHDEFEFIELTIDKFDMTEESHVHKVLQYLDFDVFLHLAAYTNVEKAETEPELAYKLNVDATRYLFEAVQNKNAKFIYISTDFVFDGKNPPYYEDSVPNPLSVYGKTKWEGEQVIKDAGMIVRICYPYRAKFDDKKDIVRTIKSLLEQGKTLTMVEDTDMTPTFVDDIAYALKYLMNNYSPEIFHIVGADIVSPFAAGKLIAKTFGLDESLVNPTTFTEYFKGKAPRPQHAEMRTKKNTFYKMKTFEEGLQVIKKQS